MLNTAARIRAKGETTGGVDKRGNPICQVKCQGCAECIQSNQELSGVEYVRTRRGSEIFFHTECRDKIWKRKIC